MPEAQAAAPEEIYRWVFAETTPEFFAALAAAPALEAYVAPYVGLTNALGLMSATGMFGNSPKIGVHHPELLTEQAYEIVGALIEGQPDLDMRADLEELRENLRSSLDGGLDRD